VTVTGARSPERPVAASVLMSTHCIIINKIEAIQRRCQGVNPYSVRAWMLVMLLAVMGTSYLKNLQLLVNEFFVLM